MNKNWNENLTALTTSEASQMIGVSEACLRKWRAKGHGPDFVKFPRAIRYLRRDIESWLERKKVSQDSFQHVAEIAREVVIDALARQGDRKHAL